MNIDKELIQVAVDEALENVLNKYDIIENSEDIVDFNNIEELNKKNNTQSEPPINEKVIEKVEEAIDDESNYNFLGLDITISKNGDKYDVTIKKDDKEKTESVDSAELPAILGLVEDFFNEIVIDEENIDEKSEDEELDEEDEDVKLDGEDEKEEDDDEESEEDKEDDEENEDVKLDVEDEVLMSSLRKQYKNKVNEIFEHGLMAKELVLGMIKEKLVAGTVKELIDKSKEKDAIIASKKEELKKASLNYLIAKKMNNQYKNVYTVLSSGIENIKKNLTDNKIDIDIANKVLNKYKIIISEVVTAKSPEALIAAINKTNRVNKAVLAYINKTKTEQSKTLVSNKIQNNTTKKEIKNIVKPVNVLNRTGWKTNSTILANRYDGIEEMSAEILRIAGIND